MRKILPVAALSVLISCGGPPAAEPCAARATVEKLVVSPRDLPDATGTWTHVDLRTVTGVVLYPSKNSGLGLSNYTFTAPPGSLLSITDIELDKLCGDPAYNSWSLRPVADPILAWVFTGSPAGKDTYRAVPTHGGNALIMTRIMGETRYVVGATGYLK